MQINLTVVNSIVSVLVNIPNMATLEHSEKAVEQRLSTLLSTIRTGTRMDLVPAAIEEEARINRERQTDYGATHEARLNVKRRIITYLSAMREGADKSLASAAAAREAVYRQEVATLEVTAEPVAATPPHKD